MYFQEEKEKKREHKGFKGKKRGGPGLSGLFKRSRERLLSEMIQHSKTATGLLRPSSVLQIVYVALDNS